MNKLLFYTLLVFLRLPVLHGEPLQLVRGADVYDVPGDIVEIRMEQMASGKWKAQTDVPGEPGAFGELIWENENVRDFNNRAELVEAMTARGWVLTSQSEAERLGYLQLRATFQKQKTNLAHAALMGVGVFSLWALGGFALWLLFLRFRRGNQPD